MGHVARSEFLHRLYAAYNARDLDGLMAGMAADVDWPNALDGGRVRGRDDLRSYWRQQWAYLSPEMEPRGARERSDGRLAVTVHQTVRDEDGSVLFGGLVCHLYTFDGDLVSRMDVEETPEPPAA